MNNNTFQIVNRLRTCKEYNVLNQSIKKNNDSFDYFFKNMLIAKHFNKEKKVLIENQKELNMHVIEKINGIFEIFKFPFVIENNRKEFYIKNNRTFQTQKYNGNEIELKY